MNRDQLLEVLDKFGVPTFQHDTTNGGTVVVAQRGARLLGLFPRLEGRSGNAIWVNPHLEAILGGTQPDWENGTEGEGGVGGDRLWISPERNYFYKDPRAFDGWFAQPALDPGAYEEVARQERSVTYESRADLRDYLHGAPLHGLVMRRRFTVLENPLSGAPALKEFEDRIGYAGVEIAEVVELAGGAPPPAPICPWGLTQVAPSASGPGTLLVTAASAEPIGYFGAIPPERLRVAEDHVAFRVDGQGICKLGLRAEDLPPAGSVFVVYLAPASSAREDDAPTREDWILVVRESSDVSRTSDDALDPAKADPDGPRGVIQAYNSGPDEDDPELFHQTFGEMEMQYRPLSQDEDGLWRATPCTRLMSFQGARDEILRIATGLTGLGEIQVFD